jgi:hypothetical protein
MKPSLNVAAVCDRRILNSLVPKLHLGTSLSPQLRCSGGEAQLRKQVRSQVQLGNEERGGSV